MITSVQETSLTFSSTVSTAETVVDDSFIAMLSERFNNDDIPDPVQAAKGMSFDELTSAKALLGVETDGNSISLSDIGASVKQDFASFRQMLDIALNEAGISKDPAFEVTSDSSGNLHISSEPEHPDKEKIEKILNETSNIRDSYMRMSANSSMLAAAERHMEFSRAYELDPQSAVQKYSYLFNEKSCDVFSVFVSEDEYKPSLTSYGQDANLKIFDEIMEEQKAAGEGAEE